MGISKALVLILSIEQPVCMSLLFALTPHPSSLSPMWVSAFIVSILAHCSSPLDLGITKIISLGLRRPKMNRTVGLIDSLWTQSHTIGLSAARKKQKVSRKQKGKAKQQEQQSPVASENDVFQMVCSLSWFMKILTQYSRNIRRFCTAGSQASSVGLCPYQRRRNILDACPRWYHEGTGGAYVATFV